MRKKLGSELLYIQTFTNCLLVAEEAITLMQLTCNHTSNLHKVHVVSTPSKFKIWCGVCIVVCTMHYVVCMYAWYAHNTVLVEILMDNIWDEFSIKSRGDDFSTSVQNTDVSWLSHDRKCPVMCFTQYIRVQTETEKATVSIISPVNP